MESIENALNIKLTVTEKQHLEDLKKIRKNINALQSREKSKEKVNIVDLLIRINKYCTDSINLEKGKVTIIDFRF